MNLHLHNKMTANRIPTSDIYDSKPAFSDIIMQLFRKIFNLHNRMFQRQKTIEQVYQCPWAIVEDVFKNPVALGI